MPPPYVSVLDYGIDSKMKGYVKLPERVENYKQHILPWSWRWSGYWLLKIKNAKKINCISVEPVMWFIARLGPFIYF